ncbi:hypothetical protein NM688_g1659 [Phlebia brevispora]|uniref:Uncharacterized protein n=1 Tax=Phlebia brevispora TaxID=194682 RepID=A0ACC1TB67_9APHY|nr:hypothetical protein NM688_g1659 [Phlebia brevispora]
MISELLIRHYTSEELSVLRPFSMTADNTANKIWFQSALLTCVAYGSIATLSLQCIFILYPNITRSALRKELPLVLYVISVFTLSTVFQGAIMEISQETFVSSLASEPDFSASGATAFSAQINKQADTTLILLCFLSDLLLLWRCTVVYRGLNISKWTIYGIASVFWLTEFSLGTVLLVQISRPGGTLNNVNLAFWSASLAINVLATLLIVCRITIYRYPSWVAFNHTSNPTYTSTIAMVIESGMIYALTIILYIHPIAHVQTIAALMIVYRVALGRAWTTDTHKKISAAVSDLQFGAAFTVSDPTRGDITHAGEEEGPNTTVDTVIPTLGDTSGSQKDWT